MQQFRQICDTGQGEYTGVGGLDLAAKRGGLNGSTQHSAQTHIH
jgi:hypothetical protein